jgi:hypothetical protein
MLTDRQVDQAWENILNAFELAIIRVARQYEEKLRNGPVSDEERRQGERVLRWAEVILEKMNHALKGK